MSIACTSLRSIAASLVASVVLAAAGLYSADSASPPTASPPATTLAQLATFVRAKSKTLETSHGTRLGFQTLLTEYNLAPTSVSYSDYAVVRLLFEATRDKGLWNLNWDITDMPPNSDNIWRQWQKLEKPSVLMRAGLEASVAREAARRLANLVGSEPPLRVAP